MKRVSPSWKSFFGSCSVITIQVERGVAGEMKRVTMDGLTDQGVTRTLRLIPHADGTEVDLLEAAIEVLASQMRREIEGPRTLW